MAQLVAGCTRSTLILLFDGRYLSFALIGKRSKGKIFSSRSRAPSGPASVLLCIHCTQEGNITVDSAATKV